MERVRQGLLSALLGVVVGTVFGVGLAGVAVSAYAAWQAW